jgi:hypothetical protein
MLGYSHSLNVALGSYSVDPKIGNGFTKNGAMISIPTSKFGLNMAMLPGADVQVFATDTRFWGTKLYEDNSQEVGFSIGSSQLKVIGHDLRVGVSYVHGPHSSGVLANLGFHF